MKVKKAIAGIMAGAALIAASAIPALADGFEVGGYVAQGQWMYNTVIPDYTFSQEQMTIQMTTLSVEDIPVVNVGVYEYGYMEQQIQEDGGAYTATSNYAEYGISGLSAGTFATSSAVAVAQDGYGSAESMTQIEVNLFD